MFSEALKRSIIVNFRAPIAESFIKTIFSPEPDLALAFGKKCMQTNKQSRPR